MNPSNPIVIAADTGHRWQQGAYEVWLLEGHCYLNQGLFYARSRKAVLWIERGVDGTRSNKVIAYFEGEASIDHAGSGPTVPRRDNHWFGRFHSVVPPEVRVASPLGQPAVKPAIYHRAIARRNPLTRAAIQPTQFSEGRSSAPQPDPLPPGTRRIRAFPRYEVPVQVHWSPTGTGNEWVAVIDSGVNLIIDGMEQFGSIDVLTDRMVIWTVGLSELDLTGQALQVDDMPLEIYMEGNIEFHQGDRVVFADRMYYDVRNEIGTILQAEILTPVPSYQGLLRLKADVVRQTGRDRFLAENTFITSSRLGYPSYRLQAGSVYFEDVQTPLIDPFTGAPQIDPLTGEAQIDHQQLAISRNNVLYLGPVPVFYWPTMATNLKDPQFYIDRLRIKNDSIFGTQLLSDWDMYELLGFQNPPAGTEWNASADYLSERGFGGGTFFQYGRADLFDIPGPYGGFADFWGIEDHGNDNLGFTRRDVPPEKDLRYRLLWRHRHQLPADFVLSSEIGWISDRNFLEQYFENEWDEFKDQTTGLELKRIRDNRSSSISADFRINEFFTQTEWLPRGDHFWLGQSLLGDWLTWYEHTSVGFGRLRVLSPPEDPMQLAVFAPLPWEVSSSGLRAATRQEIDLPLRLGPLKIVPYALGELAHWGDDLTGNPLNRAVGQTGVRASVPLWTVNPAVESQLWNVHGLAYKATVDGDLSWSDANRDLAELPLYDPLDDDNVEAFRRRFQFTTFGGMTPLRFDERFYALRTGMAGRVTAASTEIADDLTALRMGLHQRLQTKRGMPGQRRILDWMVLDTEAVWFPEEDRDNFGSDFGLLFYDYRWHVGDRLTLVSDGAFDFFTAGQQLVSVGTFLNRPPRGNLYVGFRVLEGPITSQVLALSYSYRMSPKWASTFGTTIDVGGNGNIGQFLSMTRIGESFLVSFGFNVDESKDNVGVNLAIEPRFLPLTRLGRTGGAQIPPAGAYGLE